MVKRLPPDLPDLNERFVIFVLFVVWGKTKLLKLEELLYALRSRKSLISNREVYVSPILAFKSSKSFNSRMVSKLCVSIPPYTPCKIEPPLALISP